MTPNPNNLRERATALRLHGILAHWSETASAEWLPGFIQWEEDELGIFHSLRPVTLW